MWLFFSILICLVLFYNYYWKRRNLPPGPAPLPFIGNVHQIASRPPGYETFQKWHKEYGGCYTYWISERPIVAVADYNLIQKHFLQDGDTFSGRETIGKLNAFFAGENRGIIFIEGDLWKGQRRFSLSALRNLGMSKPVMEEKILLEFGYLLELISEEIPSNSKFATNINLIPLIEVTVANIINQLLFGFGYHSKQELKKFGEWKDLISEFMNFIFRPGTLVAAEYPWFFQHVPYFKDIIAYGKERYDKLAGHCYEQIKIHRENIKTTSVSEDYNDYVEAYLLEIKKENPDFNEKQLRELLFDMFIAGQETTSNSTIYSIIYALNYPETQKKLQEELDKVIGSSRLITVADKSNLIYCQAFVNETLRLVNLLPQNVFHKNLKDVEINGYKIKAGTTIIPQISCVLYDERIFPDPYAFKPERFIDENGQLKKVDELIPFSIGKRQCLGESLARMELHLIISNFFNNFKVTPTNGKKPSMDKNPGVTIQPIAFTCDVQKRY